MGDLYTFDGKIIEGDNEKIIETYRRLKSEDN